MQSETAQRLSSLNHQFYQTFAEEFAATRGRLQPGVVRVLAHLPPQARILDLGSGSGELWRELARRGHRGPYLGLDFSQSLLAEARRHNPDRRRGRFLQRDLSSPDWDADLPAPFDMVLAFAVLHHLPGQTLRLQTLNKVRELLSPQGRFIHSNWQFLRSPRWRARIQPWEVVGLTQGDVDPGDYLLDWRRGGVGYRYVHHFSQAELAELAAATGFRVLETFYSDGKEGDLGMYQVWEVCIQSYQ